MLSGTTGEDTALTSDRLDGVGSESNSVTGQDSLGLFSCLCSLVQRRLIQLLWWRARHERACTLFDPLNVSFASHRGDWNDLCGHCSGLCSLGRRGLSQLLWWRSLQVRARLWPLFPRSAWAQRANVVAGTRVDGAVLSSLRSVVVRSASHCVGGHDR